MRIQSSISGHSVHSNAPNLQLQNPNPFDQSLMEPRQGALQSLNASPLGNVATDGDDPLDADDLEEKMSGDLAHLNKRVQFKNGNQQEADQAGKAGAKPKPEELIADLGPVRWNFSKETMKQFGLTYEDVKVKNPSISPQRLVNHVAINK